MVQSMVNSMVFLVIVYAAHASTGGGGNTSYRAEVEPLVKQRPELAKPLYGLRLDDTGAGERISFLENRELAGRHVGPYEFHAVDAAGKKVTVVFHTRARYLNGYGVVVADVLDGDLLSGGHFSSASRVEEELVAVSVGDR